MENVCRFPPRTVYHVVASVENYKYFVPWCIDSRVLISKPDYLEAELAVGFQLLSERYISRVTLEPGKRVEAVAKDTQLFHYLRNEWSFAPGPLPNTCFVNFGVDFSFRSVLYTQAASLFFDEVVSKMVAAYEKRCEVVYATEQQAAASQRQAEVQAAEKVAIQNAARAVVPSESVTPPSQPLIASPAPAPLAVRPTLASELRPAQPRAPVPTAPSTIARAVMSMTAESPVPNPKQAPLLPLRPSIW